MKKLFAVGVAALLVFELANVYFVMPLPGSQRVRSIDVAYALYRSRWAIRSLCVAAIVAGLVPAWRVRGWRRALVPLGLALAAVVAYATNVRMSADRIFRTPDHLDMQLASRNVVPRDRLVLGVEIDGDARAYPIQFIGYHHQVRDTIAGRPLLVTYCTVCRAGRAFAPLVGGRVETFRLVGMDHFNAMLEDASTGSWWRQANGEAIAGPKRGATLPEIPSRQTTLAMWLTLHPGSRVMQPDPALRSRYSTSYDFETGASRSTLTGTDRVSWHDKAWVVGLTAGTASRAYDWNQLRRERVINDTLGSTPVVVALATDGVSFFAFARPDVATRFAMRGDSLVATDRAYALSGRGTARTLPALPAYQEFWHSWRSFHPTTTRY